MKPSNVARALAVAITNNHNMMLVGPPGIGKTDLVKQAAEAAGFKLLISHPVVSDPTDYKGMPWVVADETGRQIAKFLPFSQLRTLVDTKVPTVFLLDDMGQAPPLVQAASMQLLLARAIDDIAVSDKVTFLACTNRREDKAGVQGILEPVKSRFVSIIEVEPDVEDWARWAIESKQVPFKVISFLRWRPELLCHFKPTRNMTNSPSPRSVHNVCKILNAAYPKELEAELIKGAVGESWTVEYRGFDKYEEQLPNVNKILQDPDKGDVLPEAHVTYALCGALAERATSSTFPNIVKYADRLRRENKYKSQIVKPRPEFGIMLIKDCLLKDHKLRKSPAFLHWQIENKDIIL